MKWMVGFLIIMLLNSPINIIFAASIESAVKIDSDEQSNNEWIVKWKEQPEPSQYYSILELQEKFLVGKVQFYNPDMERAKEVLKNDPNVVYFERNNTMKIHAAYNDPSLNQQTYLDTTNIVAAWDQVTINTDLTIAFVDTGIDFNHEDLKGSILKGANLIDPTKPPIDDNGHGTQMAGIIGAKRNNNIGIAGILSGVQLMPIKVMDANGTGEAYHVAAGIREAVELGADIVVLSLGDPMYSVDMEDAAKYAESKGVLVVAATGNDADRVNYPAAFPTVLAVGAVDANLSVPEFSNRGPEVDVVAPGVKIYTTFLNSKYGTASGTSLAAPQVAGLAGLIMSKFPDYTPAQIRDMIRYYSNDIGALGWDTNSGYGIIDALKTINGTWKKDFNEPNNTISQSKVLPVNSTITGELVSGIDEDWFKITTRYEGKVNFRISSNDFPKDTQMAITLYSSNKREIGKYVISKPDTFDIRLDQGTYYIRLSNQARNNSYAFTYQFTNKFFINDDSYEPNNTADTAKQISINQDSLTGTISKQNDTDWYSIEAPANGRITFRVTTDTIQLDPVLRIITSDQKELKVDKGNVNNKQKEEISLDIKAGVIKFGIENYYGYPVNAEYTVTWDYEPMLVDQYEPNNTLLNARAIALNKTIYGNIGSLTDYDWFKFTVSKDGFIQIDGSNFPLQVSAKMALYDSKYKSIAAVNVSNKQTKFSYQRWLTKGTYFIRLDADSKFTDQLYELKVSTLESVFRDINNSWAKDSINRMTSLGVINGYDDKTFRPNNPITRAEFVSIIMETLDLPKESRTAKSPFRDVTSAHWAYTSILGAYNQGLLRGYDDKTFRPNDPITRAEMATLLVKGLKIKPAHNSNTTNPNPQTAVYRFKDVHARYWATTSISFLVQLGLINGYEDRTFRPENNTSRAETTVLIERIWYAK